ncbi:MAG: RidA family protein [Alphaproteobacteria bacterium]|nr:RidA family protein [Alphaproteobacteria bacterium]
MAKLLHPKGWAPAIGYANGVSAEGRLVFVAGQVGWDAQSRIVSDDLAAQARQALANIVAVLAEGGAKPEHICRMTWYVVDKDDYAAKRREIGAAYRDLIGRHFPAMTLVQVAALLEEGAKVEIEATAVVPPRRLSAPTPAAERRRRTAGTATPSRARPKGAGDRKAP